MVVSSTLVHKILRSFKWTEFGAVKVDYTVATAVVFPNLDWDANPAGYYDRVLFHPPFTETCGGDVHLLPDGSTWGGNPLDGDVYLGVEATEEPPNNGDELPDSESSGDSSHEPDVEDFVGDDGVSSVSSGSSLDLGDDCDGETDDD